MAASVPAGSPEIAQVLLPIPRDRLLHLWVAAVLISLGLAAVLAHAVGRPVGPAAFRALSWLPVLYGPPAGLAALYLALVRAPGTWAYRFHAVAMAGGVLVGGSGALVHAARVGRAALEPVSLLGSTALAPLAFAVAGTVGWIAAWSDEARGVGRAPETVMSGVAPPVPGRAALLWVTGIGLGAMTIVMGVDHAAGGYTLGEMVGGGVAAWSLLVVIFVGSGSAAARWQAAHVWTMLVDVVVGFCGLALHLSANMAGEPAELLHRMILGAPIGAPLALSALGLLGLLAVAEPADDAGALEAAWPPRPRRRREVG